MQKNVRNFGKTCISEKDLLLQTLFEVCVVSAMEALLKTGKAIEKVKAIYSYWGPAYSQEGLFTGEAGE